MATPYVSPVATHQAIAHVEKPAIQADAWLLKSVKEEPAKTGLADRQGVLFQFLSKYQIRAPEGYAVRAYMCQLQIHCTKYDLMVTCAVEGLNTAHCTMWQWAA